MKTILVFVSAAFFLIACGSQREVPSSADNLEEFQQALPGEWEWIKTRCCFQEMTTTTPSDCECTKKMVFEKDGSFRAYEDNELDKQGQYELKRGDEARGSFRENTVLLELSEGFPAIVNLQNDTLIIDRGYMDLEKKYFIRK